MPKYRPFPSKDSWKSRLAENPLHYMRWLTSRAKQAYALDKLDPESRAARPDFVPYSRVLL